MLLFLAWWRLPGTVKHVEISTVHERMCLEICWVSDAYCLSDPIAKVTHMNNPVMWLFMFIGHGKIKRKFIFLPSLLFSVSLFDLLFMPVVTLKALWVPGECEISLAGQQPAQRQNPASSCRTRHHFTGLVLCCHGSVVWLYFRKKKKTRWWKYWWGYS